MMWKNDFENFSKLEKACGNRYLAIRFVCKTSRRLSYQARGYAPESQILTWAISGDEPKYCYYDAAKSSDPDIEVLNSYLDYVTDKEVCDAVHYMYINSLRHRHLIYDYKYHIAEYKLSRSRVLLRMVWYDCNKKGDKQHG